MLRLTGLLALVAELVQAVALAPRADNVVLRARKPALAEVLALPQYRSYSVDPWSFDIEWDVVPSLANRSVLITLYSGQNLSSARDWGVIASDADNNGSYTVRSADSEAWTYSSTVAYPSQCNYTFGLKIWTYAVYTDYFAIVNANDGGLPTGVKCPGDSGQRNIAQNFVNVQDGSTGTATDSTSSPNSNSNSNNSNNSNSSSGTSSTTLIVAIVVPIVILLIAFAVIIFLGIRRGWFLTKTQKRALEAPTFGGAPPIGREPSEYWGKFARRGEGMGAKLPEVSEMNGRADPSELQSRATGPHRVELQ